MSPTLHIFSQINTILELHNITRNWYTTNKNESTVVWRRRKMTESDPYVSLQKKSFYQTERSSRALTYQTGTKWELEL